MVATIFFIMYLSGSIYARKKGQIVACVILFLFFCLWDMYLFGKEVFCMNGSYASNIENMDMKEKRLALLEFVDISPK